MARRWPFLWQRPFHFNFVEEEARRGGGVVRRMRNPARPGEGIQVLDDLLAISLEPRRLLVVTSSHSFLDFALHLEPTQVQCIPFGITDAQVVDTVPSRNQGLLLVRLPGPQEQQRLRHAWFLQGPLNGDVMDAFQRRAGGVGEAHHHRSPPRAGRGAGMNAHAIVAVLLDQLRHVRARSMWGHRPRLVLLDFPAMSGPHFDASGLLIIKSGAERNLMAECRSHFQGRAFVLVQVPLRLIDIGLGFWGRALHRLAGDLLGPFEITEHLRLVEKQRAADAVEALGLAVGRQLALQLLHKIRVEPEQVAHRVRVFLPVQPSHQDASARHARLALRVLQIRAHPLHHGKGRLGIRPRLVLGRHLAAVDLIDDLMPVVSRGALEEIRAQFIDAEARLRLLRIMAGVAVLFQKRTHLALVIRRGGQADRVAGAKQQR